MLCTFNISARRYRFHSLFVFLDFQSDLCHLNRLKPHGLIKKGEEAEVWAAFLPCYLLHFVNNSTDLTQYCVMEIKYLHD